MTLALEQAITEVWPQALVENAKTVVLGIGALPCW
jgi:hypothetical protein